MGGRSRSPTNRILKSLCSWSSSEEEGGGEVVHTEEEEAERVEAELARGRAADGLAAARLEERERAEQARERHNERVEGWARDREARRERELVRELGDIARENRRQCESEPDVVFKLDLSHTPDQVVELVADVARRARSFYIGAAWNISERWHGKPAGKGREAMPGHKIRYRGQGGHENRARMVVVDVMPAHRAVTLEDDLIIQFRNSYSPRVCENRRGGGGGIPDYGIYFIYVVWRV
jgi:hypothetical protein